MPGLAVTTAADGMVTVAEPFDGVTDSQFPPVMVEAESATDVARWAESLAVAVRSAIGE